MKKRAAAVAALLVLAGCGSAEQATSKPNTAGSQNAGSQKIGSCTPSSPEVTGAKTIAAVDLDGDGSQEKVRLTANGGACGSTLFAKVQDGYVSTTLDSDGPDVISGYAVDPGGDGGQLLVTRADHPRGGFQLRIYSAASGQLEELEADGRALLPFVATDVQEHPWSIDCSDDGLVVTEAVAHEPPGVAAAWDIQQTTYAVDDGTVTAGPTKEIADNVLPQDLAVKYPDLVKHSAFESCRA